MEAKTDELIDAATAELDDVLDRGGAFSAVEEMKTRLVQSQAERVARIESGEQMVVGVNCFTDTADSPAHRRVGAQARADHRVRGAGRRGGLAGRGATRPRCGALDELRRAAEDPTPTSWPRPWPWPGPAAPPASGGRRSGRSSASTGPRPGSGAPPAPTAPSCQAGSARARALAERTGSPPRLLVGKPGLDGHSNGAEQIAVAARDAGFEVIYQGIRLTPEQIVAAARDEDVDVVGLSILSGSHLELVPEVLDRLAAAAKVDAPVVVGGIIPPEDAEILIGKGVAAVYTPKDFAFGRSWTTWSTLVERRRDGPALSGPVSSRRPVAPGAATPAGSTTAR